MRAMEVEVVEVAWEVEGWSFGAGVFIACCEIYIGTFTDGVLYPRERLESSELKGKAFGAGGDLC